MPKTRYPTKLKPKPVPQAMGKKIKLSSLVKAK